MTKFQQLLSAKQAVVAPGAFDGLSARLVKWQALSVCMLVAAP